MLLLSCLPGCSAAVESESTSQTSSELVTDNRLAQNRLAQNRLAQNRLAQNKLASNRIDLDVTAAGDLLATESGREVLSYIVGCAIPEGQTMVASYSGTTYEFQGALGLAPDWVMRPLDRKGQHWVSACLLARVNAAGIMVQISLRGPHRALSTTPDELATWTLEEGAFWGNLFNTEPIDWNACRGLDQAAGESGELADRDCTEPDPENPGFTLCGFQYAGDCGDFVAQPACRSFDADGMYYESCSTPSPGGHERYREVITTFVMP